MRNIRMVEMDNFNVWVIAIRSHLGGRNCARSAEIWYSEYSLADYAFNTTLDGKVFCMKCLCLVKTIDFHI